MNIKSYDRNVTAKECEIPLYAVTVGECAFQESVYRPFGVEDYQLLYTAKGHGRVRMGDEVYDVKEGTVFLLPPFTPHEYRAAGDEWQTLWLTYSGIMARSIFPFPAGIRACPSFPRYHREILRHDGRRQWRRSTSATLYALLLDIAESQTQAEEPITMEESGIGAAVRYICEHYTETLELRTLAAVAECSEGHFCRLFRTYTHMRPVEYITHLRIEAAKELLLNEPQKTAAEISHSVGYTSPSYFTRVFSAIVGMTPDSFRKQGHPETK